MATSLSKLQRLDDILTRSINPRLSCRNGSKNFARRALSERGLYATKRVAVNYLYNKTCCRI